jgi:FkbM family methyltransferase
MQVADFGAIEWCDSPNYGWVCGLACDQVIFPRVKAGALWEPEIATLFESLIRPGSIAVDAGANIGIHSLAMVARQPKLAQALAFEPHPEIFRCLQQNAARDPRIRPFNKGLGHMRHTLSMPKLNADTSPNPAGMPMFVPGHEFAVEVIPLDSLSLTNVSLVKIDVEGMEEQVIDGAMNLLQRERPALIVELLPEVGDRQCKIERLCSLGYRAETITAHDVLFAPV